MPSTLLQAQLPVSALYSDLPYSCCIMLRHLWTLETVSYPIGSVTGFYSFDIIPALTRTTAGGWSGLAYWWLQELLPRFQTPGRVSGGALSHQSVLGVQKPAKLSVWELPLPPEHTQNNKLSLFFSLSTGTFPKITNPLFSIDFLLHGTFQTF